MAETTNEAPSSPFTPVWRLKAGRLVLLSLPVFREAPLAALYLGAGLAVAATMSMALVRKPDWRWIWLVGLGAAAVQIGLGVASLVALRWQRRRV